MMLLRFLSVSIITFLLLTPLIRRTTRQVEKPVIAIGIDASQSVVSATDSVEVRQRLIPGIEDLSRKLSDRFEIVSYTFGQDVSAGLQTGFMGKHTDISEFLNDLGGRFVNRNLGAVVIATDGIYNKGSNPVYAAHKLGVPVYSIALGDTSLHEDVLIKFINTSKQVYLDDQFPFEIMIELDKFAGRNTTLTIRHSGATVFSRPVNAYDERSFVKVSGTLQAKEKGIQKYSVLIETAGNEFNKANNKRDFYVEVLESRIRVALVYEIPHPDISAIVSALGSSAKFQLTQLKPGDLQNRPKEFDLYIFYQLPSPASLTDPSKLLPQGSPALYIVGSQTDLTGFNRIKTGLAINSPRRSVTDIQAILNPDFSLFGFSKDASSLIREFPPLQSPSGTFETGVPTDVLFYQKIGNVGTKFPLVMFFDTPQRKTGIIAGENIWRWRMSDYMQKSDFVMFDEMFSKIVQYLAVKNDPSPFRINVKNRLEEGDPLEFDAMLFNPSHEPVNAPDVMLELKNEEGKIYPFLFTRTDKAYYLNAGYFPSGSYTYNASVKTAQAVYRKQGMISIMPMDIEFVNLVADHALLQQMSARNEGKMVLQKDIPGLADLIMKRNDLKPVSHLQRRYTELTGEWWMFLLIIILLSAEWAIRKRNGI